MMKYLLGLVAIILGVIATKSDFQEMKIYNKNIKWAVIVSSAIYLICFREIEVSYLDNYLINLGISLVISFLFFYFKIWAAGDAKLFLAIVFMIPYSVYGVDINNVFPALNLLIIIFSIAFIYVVLESIYLGIRDKKRHEKMKHFKLTKNEIKDFLLPYFLGYFVILFINNMFYTFLEGFRFYNGSLIMLCNMLLLVFIYQVIRDKKQVVLLMVIFMGLNVIYYGIFGIVLQGIDVKMLGIVLVIMLFRSMAEKYNYEVIKITDLKSRMILSYGSVMKFYGSRVKGLPKGTTESTDSRLTEEEVLSIKRWSKSKRGQDDITIVKHLPFAPFILLGEIIFFVIKLYS